MTTYAKRKLKYSRNENFNLLHYVEWDRIVTLSQHKRTEGYIIVSRKGHVRYRHHLASVVGVVIRKLLIF